MSEFQRFSFSGCKDRDFAENVINAVQRDKHLNGVDVRDLFVKAAELGHAPVIELFLSFNSNLAGTFNSAGETALLRAARNGHEEVVEKLLTTNVDVDRGTVWGSTPLWSAIFNEHDRIVLQLLAAGAQIPTTISSSRPISPTVKSSVEWYSLIKIAFVLLPLNLPVLVVDVIYRSIPQFGGHTVSLHRAWNVLKAIKQ